MFIQRMYLSDEVSTLLEWLMEGMLRRELEWYRKRWWAILGSNQRPQSYQDCALTS